MSEQGLVHEPSPSSPEAGLTAADVACLAAAKVHGLLRKRGGNAICPQSTLSDTGWWARSSWSAFQVDQGKGGPWSCERVHLLCELGLLGVHPDEPSKAVLTSVGAKLLRTMKPTAAKRTRSEESGTGRLGNTKNQAPESSQ